MICNGTFLTPKAGPTTSVRRMGMWTESKMLAATVVVGRFRALQAASS